MDLSEQIALFKRVENCYDKLVSSEEADFENKGLSDMYIFYHKFKRISDLYDKIKKRFN